MKPPSTPSRPTIKRLFALSGNRCAFPDCETRLVDRATGSIVGEVCHIKGEKPPAPRYDPQQDDYARHGFENLLVLCNVHHKVIDDNPTDYSVDHLLAMKEDVETRQSGKEAIDDKTAEEFTVAAVNYFVEQGSVIHATNISGGQVAHTITNNYLPSPEEEPVRIEGRTVFEVGLVRTFGCPGLVVTVACRSKRPAKLRRAKLCLEDEGIMAAFEAGFGQEMKHVPVPGMKEELSIDLFPLQAPTTSEGFVLQQDDVARFALPVAAGPVGLFLDRPESAVSIRVEFFDNSERTIIEGREVQAQLKTLIEIAQQVPCRPFVHPVAVNVKVNTTSVPDMSLIGRVNQNPISFENKRDISPPEHPG